MTSAQPRTLDVFAPAKINLFLHVTGRRDDGYHLIDSLVSFADIGDRLQIGPAQAFCFSVRGPFADGFSAKETDCSPDSANLAVQAAWTLARNARKEPKVKIELSKALPLASGLGGGSADAAAVLWGLNEWWGLPHNAPYLEDVTRSLGSDVPVCMACLPVRMQGVGEVLQPAPHLPEVPVVLVHPGRACPTAEIYRLYDGAPDPAPGEAPLSALSPSSSPLPSPSPSSLGQISLPDGFDSAAGLCAFLRERTRNDLTAPARTCVPQIGDVLAALESREGCVLSRMSGSGAACFGLFEREDEAVAAARALADSHPGWWVRAGILGRPSRY